MLFTEASYEGDGEHSSTLYDKQAERWVRDKPNCLSDFTGRPRLFEACGDVTGKSILDVGCGEGYCARYLRRAGAATVVGVDVSDGMIQAANAAEQAQNLGGLSYLTGDATALSTSLASASVQSSDFDMAIATFLFNYVTIDEMASTMLEVRRLLRPGGAFVFSVPHPMMAGAHHESAHGAFGFGGDGSYSGYFSSRDVSLPGVITTRDGQRLNVRMMHKTFEDYFRSIRAAGLLIDAVVECAVTEAHCLEDPNFFGPLKDVPLHVVFRSHAPA